MKILIVLAALLIPTLSIACGSNYDCAYGSQCVKRGGELFGVCAGGRNPGNGRKAEYDDSLNSQEGSSCSYSHDCGTNERCVKQSGYNYGVCVR